MSEFLFFNKVASLKPATLLKKRLWHRCFTVNFAKFLRTAFLQNTSGWLLLLATNEMIFSNLFSLMIVTITYHASKMWYIRKYTITKINLLLTMHHHVSSTKKLYVIWLCLIKNIEDFSLQVFRAWSIFSVITFKITYQLYIHKYYLAPSKFVLNVLISWLHYSNFCFIAKPNFGTSFFSKLTTKFLNNNYSVHFTAFAF